MAAGITRLLRPTLRGVLCSSSMIGDEAPVAAQATDCCRWKPRASLQLTAAFVAIVAQHVFVNVNCDEVTVTCA